MLMEPNRPKRVKLRHEAAVNDETTCTRSEDARLNERQEGRAYPPINLSGSAHAHLGDVHNYRFAFSDEHRECHQAFKTSNYEQHKDVNPRNAEGTCAWVTKHERFKQWRQRRHDDLLWISADPGCGKSVLTRFLIDEWLPQHYNGATVCYFFFKDNDEQSQVTTALCAILHQLFSMHPALLHAHASLKWKETGKSIQREMREMWRILMNAANDYSVRQEPIICVMDALDECHDEDRRQLIEMLCAFYSATPKRIKNTANIKFIVTSRPYDNVERWFRPVVDAALPEIRLRGEDENDSINCEIDLVVKSRVEDLAQEFRISEHKKMQLLDELLGMKHRTYLWLRLAIEEIREAVHDSLDPDTLEIERVPQSVEHAYERILYRVKNTQGSLVKTVLKIIVGARRPLSVEEMALALATVKMGEAGAAQLVEVKVDHIEKQIRHWCGLFVFINHSKLYLIHQTAKEFLVAKRCRPSSSMDKWQGTVHENDCENLMANLTIDYLLLLRFFQCDKRRELLARPCVWESNSFFKYCSMQWTSHLEACTKKEAQLLAKSLTLYDATPSNEDKPFRSWVQVPWQEHLGRVRGLPGNVDSHHAAALLGSVVVLEATYQARRFNVDSVCDFGKLQETALTLAVRQGHTSVVRWLIDKGASVNIDTSGPMPLELAITNTSLELVRVLLDAGADPNSPCENGWSALYLTVRLNLPAIAKLLLGYGADVNARCRKEETMLHSTVRFILPAIAKLLLGHDVDMNVLCGQNGDQPLHVALRSGKTIMAGVLIEHGADINTLSGNLETPLQIAWSASTSQCLTVFENNVDEPDSADIVNMLIDRGARKLGLSRLLDIFLTDLNLSHQLATPRDLDILALGNMLKRSCDREFLRPDVFELLIDHGKCFTWGVNTKEEALLWAAAWGHYTSVQKLLAMHVNIHSTDEHGRCALDIAVENHHQITAALLVEAGAQPGSESSRRKLTELRRGATHCIKSSNHAKDQTL